jgi:hypothetical protein
LMYGTLLQFLTIKSAQNVFKKKQKKPMCVATTS